MAETDLARLLARPRSGSPACQEPVGGDGGGGGGDSDDSDDGAGGDDNDARGG